MVLLAGFLSCQKKAEMPTTTDEVVMVITSPQAGKIYKQGDTVNINGSISYKSQLHGYIARIYDQDRAVVYETEGHTHSDNLSIHEAWVNTLNYSTNLSLEVITVIDHNENKKTVKVDFKSQP